MTTECPKCQTNNPDSQRFCGDCGTSLDIDVSQTKTIQIPTDELMRGYTFADRYEIIEELGRGGMGRVFRVEDAKAKEEIALKVIKPEIADDKKTIERFRNELKVARKIRHKNVCAMFDLGEEKGIKSRISLSIILKILEAFFMRLRLNFGPRIIKKLRSIIRKQEKLIRWEVHP